MKQVEGRLGDWYSTTCELRVPVVGHTSDVTGVVDVPTSAATVAPTTVVLHRLLGVRVVPGVHVTEDLVHVSETAPCLRAHCSVEKLHVGRR